VIDTYCLSSERGGTSDRANRAGLTPTDGGRRREANRHVEGKEESAFSQMPVTFPWHL